MGPKTTQSVAEEYFYGMNSLAKRIGQDVAATKEAYEGLWNSLSVKEQNQAIDETIIQPEVALKYAIKKAEGSKQSMDYYPKLRIQTGLKYVIDETGSTLRWKDEHSAPFSFMTQSQMNLNVFEDICDEPKNPNFNNYLIESPRFQSSIQMPRMTDVSEDQYDSSNFFQSDNRSGSVFFKADNCVLPKSDSVNEEILLDTSGSFNSFESSLKETEIPKTGFEFLDNW